MRTLLSSRLWGVLLTTIFQQLRCCLGLCPTLYFDMNTKLYGILSQSHPYTVLPYVFTTVT